jgi:ribosomal protein S18 acetylase RimI-like enzyme
VGVASTLALETALPSDALPIARLSRRLIERGLDWRWTPGAVAAQIRDPDTEVLVARRGRAIAGFAIMSFRFEQREAHLLLLAVDLPHRRRGLGRALFEWLASIARAGDVASVLLEVRADSPAARAFYQSLGFEEAGRLTRYYDGRLDAVRMRSTIGARSAGRAGGAW